MSIGKSRQTQAISRSSWRWSLVFAALTLLASTVVGTAWGDDLPLAFSAKVELELGNPLSCENTDDDIQDVIEQMADLGYGVATGEFKPYKVQIPLGQRAYVPTIAGIHIPFDEHNSVYMVAEFDGAVPAQFFAPRDALVFRGCTPLGIGNFRFSFNSFLVEGAAGVDESGTPLLVPLQASLADPLWLEELLYEPNDDSVYDAPYDRKINVAFTADRQTYADIQTAFENEDLGGVNRQAWPGELIDYSVAFPDGELVGGNKLTVMMKWDRIRQYHPNAYELAPEFFINTVWSTQSFPFYVFYRDEEEPFVEAFPVDLRQTKPPTWQKQLAKQYRKPFNNLVKEVISQYEMQGLNLISDASFDSDGAFVEGQPVFNAEHGVFCVDTNTECQFDSYADNYWWDQRAHQLGDGDVYVVVGIDHAKLGMAEGRSYLGIFDLEDEGGLALNELDSWTGSELAWSTVDEAIVVSDPSLEPVAGLSFLVELTRPDNCLDVKSREYALRCLGTDVIAGGDSFVFRGRTSFNPETGTQPSNSQLIAWRLLHFKL